MENSPEFIEKGYSIQNEIRPEDIIRIHRFLSTESYWAKNIPFSVVEKSITHSLCFGVYFQNTLVGFARLVTDRATFAYLADVFIMKEHRGKGLSKWLMENIHARPDLQGLRRWMLGTLDAHGLYAKFGWTPLPENQVPRFMQLHRPDVYRQEGS